MRTDAKKLVETHNNLNHSQLVKVASHIQRKQGEWILHTLMVEGCDATLEVKSCGFYSLRTRYRSAQVCYSLFKIRINIDAAIKSFQHTVYAEGK